MQHTGMACICLAPFRSIARKHAAEQRRSSQNLARSRRRTFVARVVAQTKISMTQTKLASSRVRHTIPATL